MGPKQAGLLLGTGQVHEKLHEIMSREFNNVYDMMTNKELDMRTAAYVLGLNRIGEAVESLGTMKYFAADDLQATK